MDEQIVARDLDTPEITFPMSRKAFYKEQIEIFEKTGKSTKSVDVIHVLLFNDNYELYIQKRARTKAHNAGLFDKSLGGHIKYGDTAVHTMMLETVQELQVPSIVLKTGNDFIKTYKVLEKYLSTVALLMPIDNSIIKLPKIIKGEKIDIVNYTHLYVGIYAGRTKTVDREAVGILEYSLKDLEYEMKALPDMFTIDLKMLYERYSTNLKSFVKLVKKISAST